MFTDIFPIGHFRCGLAHTDDLVFTLLEDKRGRADLRRDLSDIISILVKRGDYNLEIKERIISCSLFAEADGFFEARS